MQLFKVRQNNWPFGEKSRHQDSYLLAAHERKKYNMLCHLVLKQTEEIIEQCRNSQGTIT